MATTTKRVECTEETDYFACTNNAVIAFWWDGEPISEFRCEFHPMRNADGALPIAMLDPWIVPWIG